MSKAETATNTGTSQRVSLSSYFPMGTQYFYSYPTGEDSNFLNKVPPATDELVAARALSCAGADVSVVSFASTTAPCVDSGLMQSLAIPEISKSNLNLLPSTIDINLVGRERNEAIMAALAKTVAPRSLVMAQPFSSKKMESLYEIAPNITIWLNDKSNMSEYISPDMMPARLADYSSGVEFSSDKQLLSRTDILPCVVKVSSSSSGDGVYICHTRDNLVSAQADVGSIDVNVLVEQYITTVKNYAIHFGIPHDRNKPIDIIGFNEQLTTADGEFLGGIITDDDFSPVLDAVKQYLLTDVLPAVRARGWYGVGGYDVIIDDHDNAFLIDGNFRMTGMSAYHFLMANGDITKPMVSFSGQFRGTQQDFESAILPFAGKDSDDKSIQLIALSKHAQRWDFNGALMYSSANDLSRTIEKLFAAGITSPALEQFTTSA